MTLSNPPVAFPGTRPGRDMTGRPLTAGLVLIMSRPAAPPSGHSSQPAPPRWPGDRSGQWLRNAAAGLCLLAAAAAAVSFTAQYRMAEAARRLPAIAALEAAIPDAAALVFACLGIALALHGRRALRARALNLASVGASVFMNAIAAEPGWRNLAIWAMPPIAYALASDTLKRCCPGLGAGPPPAARRRAGRPGGRRAGRPGGHPAGRARRPGLVAAAPGPGPRLDPGRVPRLGPGGVPGRPRPPRRPHDLAACSGPSGPGRGTVPRKATKTARFLDLVAERTGPLASIPLDRVAAISAALAPAVGLNPGAARAALRKAVLAAQNGTPR
jgi:hypothetical protein